MLKSQETELIIVHIIYCNVRIYSVNKLFSREKTLYFWPDCKFSLFSAKESNAENEYFMVSVLLICWKGKFSRNFALLFFVALYSDEFQFDNILPYSEFIHQKYGMSKTTSSYIAGAVYDVSMVLSPFLGGIIVSYGKRKINALTKNLL